MAPLIFDLSTVLGRMCAGVQRYQQPYWEKQHRGILWWLVSVGFRIAFGMMRAQKGARFTIYPFSGKCCWFSINHECLETWSVKLTQFALIRWKRSSGKFSHFSSFIKITSVLHPKICIIGMFAPNIYLQVFVLEPLKNIMLESQKKIYDFREESQEVFLKIQLEWILK